MEKKTREQIINDLIEQGVDPDTAGFAERVDEIFKDQFETEESFVESEEARIEQEQAEAQQRREDNPRGLRGEALEEYRRLGDVAAGEVESQAQRDIRAAGASLQAQRQGMASAARDPFAGARRALADRSSAEVGLQTERGVASQLQAEMDQAERLRRQMRVQGQQIYQQEQLAKQQQEDLFGGGIGGLLGALAAGGIILGGGSAIAPALAPVLLGGGQQLGTALGTRFISDKRMKSNVRDGNSEIQQFMDALSPKTYSKMGQQETGVMAQDLERSREGKKMVQEVAGVKTVKPDFNKVLASIAQLNNRINKLEG